MLLPARKPHPQSPGRRERVRSFATDLGARYGRLRRTPSAPQPVPAQTVATTAPAPAAQAEPDVLLDIQQLHVDEISLQLDDLKAHVALDARVLDLLALDVGVDAHLQGVRLGIKGVDAQAVLKVRLENLTVILERVMTTIDTNPELLARLINRVGTSLDRVGDDVAHAAKDLGDGLGGALP